MTLRLVCLCLSAAALAPGQSDLSKLLKNIEKRYNGARTLEVRFAETLIQQGNRRTEAGNLYLRKPGKMRWQYTQPDGKLFVSDGKQVYFYSPQSNRAEKMKLKETDDMRAPMAFLLGKLDFDRDFKEYRTREERGGQMITAVPKNEKLPYKEVAFLVGPDARIERLIVFGQDASILEFGFSGEKVNPALSDTLFQFKLPPGAEFVDSSGEAR